MGAEVQATDEILQLVFTTAIAIPVAMTPQGPQFMPVQDGVYRVPMRKETAIEYAKRSWRRPSHSLMPSGLPRSSLIW